jgi:hypothetical protein
LLLTRDSVGMSDDVNAPSKRLRTRLQNNKTKVPNSISIHFLVDETNLLDSEIVRANNSKTHSHSNTKKAFKKK